MSVGPAEILVILVVALVVFGPQRLPEVGRQVGAAVRELRKMQDAVRGELDMVLHPEHGTRPGDVPVEPGNHSDAVDVTSVDADATAGEPLDVESAEIGHTPPADTAPESPPSSTYGHGPVTDRADIERRFLGPPDSFI